MLGTSDGLANPSQATFFSWDPQTLLDALLAVNFLLSAIFLLCAFLVSSTANAGLVAVMSGFIFLAYPIWAYVATHSYKTHVAVGAALGSGTLCVFVSLMTIVFWGQLSVCEKISYTIRKYSCSNKIAYRAVCMLAILIFIAQLLFVLFLAHFRSVVLKEMLEYEQLSNDDTTPIDPYYEKQNSSSSSGDNNNSKLSSTPSIPYPPIASATATAAITATTAGAAATTTTSTTATATAAAAPAKSPPISSVDL